MPDVANEQITDTVSVENLKNVAGAPASVMAVHLSNVVSHANRVNVLAEQFLASATKNVHEMDPTQAMALHRTLSGNVDAGNISALMAALSSGQIGQVQTPRPAVSPVTGQPTT